MNKNLNLSEISKKVSQQRKTRAPSPEMIIKDELQPMKGDLKTHKFFKESICKQTPVQNIAITCKLS